MNKHMYVCTIFRAFTERLLGLSEGDGGQVGENVDVVLQVGPLM